MVEYKLFFSKNPEVYYIWSGIMMFNATFNKISVPKVSLLFSVMFKYTRLEIPAWTNPLAEKFSK